MEMQILQPKNCDFSKVKHEIVQEEGKIIDTVTYPNGFVLILEQTEGSIKVTPNRPLIQVSENVFQIPY